MTYRYGLVEPKLFVIFLDEITKVLSATLAIFMITILKHSIWLVGLSNSQVLHLLIGQWSDKPGNIGTVEVTVEVTMAPCPIKQWFSNFIISEPS